MKKNNQIRIKPVKRNCRCGRRIIGHHHLCNKCWKLSKLIKD